MRANKFVDFKVTVWCRAHFQDETDMNKIKEMLQVDDDSNTITDEALGFYEWETLYETEEKLPVEENDGQRTIEVYDGENHCIWGNAPEI